MTPTNSSRWSRRNFLGTVAAGSIGLARPAVANPAGSAAGLAQSAVPATAEKMSLHVFSKHLQFLDYEAMAQAAAKIGFDGVDLTVRPGGHVLPENVETDLPRAVAAVKNAGLQAQLMTTKVMDTQDPPAATVLKTAHDQGITHYRTDWLRYDREAPNLPQSLDDYRKQLQALAQLNERVGMVGGYQNHAGDHYVGAPVWDIAMLLNDVDSKHLGSQYDIRHATVEGGLAWPLGLNLIHPHINVVVVKDFRWKQQDGEWRVVNVPLGEGMVDFPHYFRLLKEYDIRCPISIHFEYEMPEEQEDLSEAERLDQTVTVMQKDVDTLKGYLSEAGL